MRIFSKKNELGNVLIIIITVRFVIFLFEYFVFRSIPVNPPFLGPIPLANFDGVHYLTIAREGYHEFQHAFFPLFPLLIRFFQSFIFDRYVTSAIVLVNVFYILLMFLFWKIVRIDYKTNTAFWALSFFVTFPTFFFITALYTEGLFLLLVFASIYFTRRGNFWVASVCAGLASATRLVGVFLLPVIVLEFFLTHKKKGFSKYSIFQVLLIGIISLSGFFAYSYYLWKNYADPLLFMHVQPAFGAGRSGGEIILLPQVLYRYGRIFLTVSPTTLTFWVSVIEMLLFLWVTTLLAIAYKKGVRKSYLFFAGAALFLPTLSGTLSSIPRYALVCFPAFIALAQVQNRSIKIILLLFGLILEAVLLTLFINGYFVS